MTTESAPAKPLVVCDVVQSWGPKSGGVKRYIEGKIKYLSQRPDVSHVLVVPGRYNSRGIRDGTVVYEVKSLPLAEGYRLLLDGSRIREIAAEEQPDVIEVDDAYWPAWASETAGEDIGASVVGFYHSDFPRSLGDKISPYAGETVGRLAAEAVEAYLAALYNRLDAAIVATRHFEELLKGIGVTNTFRVRLGVDTDLFRPLGSRDRTRSELGIRDEDYFLLFVGRLAGMKNISELLAMMDVFDPSESVRLVVVGDGELSRLVEDAAGRKDVIWLKYVDDPEYLTRLYTAADLMINPGVHETFGLVSVEAQACGTRVLGVRGGGMDETLEGESPLIMADSEDPAHLAAAVRECRNLDEGPEKRDQRVGRIRREYSLTATFDRLTELYYRLAGRRPPNQA